MTQEDIYKCHGRMQGDYQVFIPSNSGLAEKLRGSALTNNPRGSDINNNQNKRSVLDTNSKATYEKNN